MLNCVFKGHRVAGQ